MPEYLSPGVYVEEVDTGAVPIAGVGTSTAGFLGGTERGPTIPQLVTSFADFKRSYGRLIESSYLGYAVEGFFRNGGGRCYIGRITSEVGVASAALQVGGGEEVATDGGEDEASTNGDGGLRVMANGAGAWGNNVAVIVEDATLRREDLFKLRCLYWPKRREGGNGVSDEDDTTDEEATDSEGGEGEGEGEDGNGNGVPPREALITQYGEEGLVEELFDNLSIDEADSNYYETTINSASKLIEVEGRATQRPPSGTTWLEMSATGPTEGEEGGGEGEADSARTNGGVETADEMSADEEAESEEEGEETAPADEEPAAEPALTDIEGVGEAKAETLHGAGYETVADIRAADEADLAAVEGIGAALAEKIKANVDKIATDGGTDVLERTDVLTDGGDGETTAATAEDESGAVGLQHYLGNDTPGERTGLAAFREVDEIAIVCAPDEISVPGLTTAIKEHCENMKDRFAILQAPPGATEQLLSRGVPNEYISQRGYAAVYLPWIHIMDPETNVMKLVPPGGHIAGIYARSDTERGVHKAPANEMIRGAQALELNITKGEQDILNPQGINCIRSFRGRGILVWGARTTSTNALWKYVNVRRLFLYLEESIDEGTQWAVFEPNDEKLWARIRQSIGNFLTTEWRNGALMGTTPDEAFYVKCDRTTMTQDDIDNGRLICEIGVSPVKPAEFVIFRITQWTGDSAA